MADIPKDPVNIMRLQLLEQASNALATRQQLLNKLIDPNRDIDKECGYPDVISIDMYHQLYYRNGIASRVVNLYPEESWKEDPEIYEKDNEKDKGWAADWNDFAEKQNIYYYLARMDALSGVGEYGVLLLGIDDNKALSDPVDGVIPGVDFEDIKKPKKQYKLLYIRTFDQKSVTIKSYDKKISSPRYGYPEKYELTFVDPTVDSSHVSERTGKKVDVHWSRVVHFADNRSTSEVIGHPRMQPVFNALYDLKKIIGGGAEMFWKGAFPGYSLETIPELAALGAEVDTDSVKRQFELYQNSLQRYIILEGMQAKSLDQQLSDPKGHFDVEIKVICASLACPHRIFLGTEEAKLAGDQDNRAWNSRVHRRQEKYVAPMIIKPFIKRLMMLGIIPPIANLKAEFPDPSAPSDKDKAEVGEKFARAIAAYTNAMGAAELIPPMEFLTYCLGFSAKDAQSIVDASAKYIQDNDDEEDRIRQEADAMIQAGKADIAKRRDLEKITEEESTVSA